MPATLLGLPLRTLRLGAATFLAVDAVAVAAFSVQVHHVTTTSESRPAAAASAAVPASVPSAAPLPPGGAAPVGGAALASTAQSISTGTTGTSPSASASPTATASTATDPSTPASATPSAQPLGGSGDVTADHAITPCPITIDPTPASGGLQSVVDFAPAFGSFSPEAFAAASAYQPALQLIGPLLAQYPKLQPVIGPYADTFVQTLSGLTNLLGTLASPLYTPERKTEVVTAETKLASVLAPYAESLAYSSLGGCVVELESALLSQADGQPTPAAPAAQAAQVAQAARQQTAP